MLRKLVGSILSGFVFINTAAALNLFLCGHAEQDPFYRAE